MKKIETLSFLILAVYAVSATGQELSFSKRTMLINEGDSAQLCLDLIDFNMIAGTATVTIATEDSEDTIGGVDYVSISRVFSFAPTGEDRRCIAIQTIQDDAVENIEFFTVNLLNPVGIAVGNSQTIVGIYDDNDAITVDLSSTTFTSTEGQGVSICVTVLSGSVARHQPVMVGLSTTDGTTRRVEDYSNIASRLIQVPEGTMTGDTACTSLGLTDDPSVEPEETFTLSLVAGLFQPVIVTDKTASITIIDNDMAIVNVSSPLSVVEGNSGTTNFNIDVELQIGPIPLARDVIVTLSSEDGSATAGSDYQAVTADFTFVSGSANGATMTMAVPIIGDEIGEPDETFIISITPSTPDMATTATITIVNDDRDCPDLTAPVNGKISMSGIILGSIATYSCNDGYTLAGNMFRTCENSMWTGTAPVCVLGCLPLPDPPGGTVNAPSLIPGSTATYACDEGYNLIGDSARFCDDNATWTGNEPACQIVDCSFPPPIGDGRAEYNATVFGAVATYMCGEGYQLVTSTNQRTCLGSGVWSDGDIRCEADKQKDEEGDEEGLNGGETAGIVITVILVIGTIAVTLMVLVVFLTRRIQDHKTRNRISFSAENLLPKSDKFETGDVQNAGTSVTEVTMHQSNDYSLS